MTLRCRKQTLRFLSTPSVRRATHCTGVDTRHGIISIHALRAEGDRLPTGPAGCESYFYPRPPCGGRPRCLPKNLSKAYRFLSTPSVRRATIGPLVSQNQFLISIHALRAEGDWGALLAHPSIL